MRVVDLGVVAVEPETTGNPLVTPAWTVGVILGLIGLVEVIRLIIDLVI